jgi:hypothetical protein
VYDAPVREFHALPALEATVERAGRDAERASVLDIESARSVALRDSIAERCDAVFERLAGDAVFIVLIDEAGFDCVNFETGGERRA